MIGDKLIDLQCGWNAGVRKSILVRTGYGAVLEKKSGEELKEALVVDGIVEAAEWIMQDFKRGGAEARRRGDRRDE
jgi:histidinol phosphatase-like enzyme